VREIATFDPIAPPTTHSRLLKASILEQRSTVRSDPYKSSAQLSRVGVQLTADVGIIAVSA